MPAMTAHNAKHVPVEFYGEEAQRFLAAIEGELPPNLTQIVEGGESCPVCALNELCELWIDPEGATDDEITYWSYIFVGFVIVAMREISRPRLMEYRDCTISKVTKNRRKLINELIRVSRSIPGFKGLSDLAIMKSATSVIDSFLDWRVESSSPVDGNKSFH